ncbi:MAG: dethiobiotin synthase [Alphaproteobacteria bacterium]|jgi:dethiobiotin synthetase|nr:dethiobiotin synthase [Alphaproteobacteria bacterium]MBO6626788.1 dethiobiotin synthase [Alphaproteobacteria bacterium]MDF1627639.1 dethiobiotin synthase [Parvibaculaceae bacterium]
MSLIFVTSSGTDIGKTVVSSLLLAQLKAKGRQVTALKPVLSGTEGVPLDETDTGRLLQAVGVPVTEASFKAATPWAFKEPLSPDMAAAREGATLCLDELTEFCVAPENQDHILVEGAGGVLVPINETATMADWMLALKARAELKVLLVVGSYLGTISHTLSAMESLRARGLGPSAIVISTSQVNPVPVEETIRVMKRFADGVPIVAIPRLNGNGSASMENGAVPDLTSCVE